MSIVHVFYSHVLSMQYAFKDGKTAAFVGGRYVTSDENEIQELKGLCKIGTIYIKEGQETMEAEDLDPMVALRKKFYAEFMEEKLAQMNPENDRGSTEPEKLKAASTADIAPIAAGGNASQVHVAVKAALGGVRK